MPDMLITGAIGGAFYGSLTSPSGYIALGASPPTSGAIRVDAATYSDTIISAKNSTKVGSLTLTSGGSFQLQAGAGVLLDLGANGQQKWRIAADATSTLSAIAATAQIAGGATSLALTNAAVNANNIYIADAGGILLRGATGGVPSVGVINAQGFKINGVDVGTSAATYWNAGVSGGIYYSAGTVGIGGGENASIGLNMVHTSLTTTNQTGIKSAPVFSSAATNSAVALYGQINTAAAAFTMVAGYGVYVESPTFGAGSAVTTQNGIYVKNQGAAAVTNAYGVYIAAQSGAATTNIGLYNGGTTQFVKPIWVGATGNGQIAISISGTGITTAFGNSSYGIYCAPTLDSGATSGGWAAYAQLITAAGAWTMTSGYGIEVGAPTLGNTSVSTIYGIRVGNQGQAKSTNAYGIYILPQSGAVTTNIGLYNGSTSYLVGTVGIGTAPATNAVLDIELTGTSGVTQYGVYVGSTFSSGATTSGRAVQAAVITAAAAYTMVSGYAFYANTPTVGAGSAITTQYGFYAANQGVSGVTNAYGVYIAAQSGAATTNIGLYNAGTSQFQDTIGIGSAPGAGYSVYIAPNGTLTGTTQTGLYSTPTCSSAATSNGIAISAKVSSAAAAFTMVSARAFYAAPTVVGAGSAITSAHGIYADNQGTTGVTNAYGVYIVAQSGAATINRGLYNGGDSQLVGNVGINKAPTTTSKLSISGLPTSAAGLGSGDVWSNAGVLNIVP